MAGDRLEETWRRLAPRPSGRLRMDPEGTVTGFCPEELGQRVPLEGNLSGGEREQTHLAARVSLALSDRWRHRRALELLREAAEDLQILIFTCHPERYEELPEVFPRFSLTR